MNISVANESLDRIACTELKGVGPALAERLARCGIYTLQDLLFHLPLRYQDRTRIKPIAQLLAGDTALVTGTIVEAFIKPGRRPSLICYLNDGSGQLNIRFFHFNARQKENLVAGKQITVFGEVRGYGHQLSMIHPEYRHVSEPRVTPAAHLTPVYPTTAGLSQYTFMLLTDQALKWLNQSYLLKEYLPDSVLSKFKLPDLKVALNYVHRPPPDAPQEALLSGSHPMQARLSFEELLAHHLCFKQMRSSIQQVLAPQIHPDHSHLNSFYHALPFTLTRAQQRAIQDILSDIAKEKPAMRLIQGDVGSGKTLVAAVAALVAVDAGFQVAMMVPTEILSEQHLHHFKLWFGPLGIQVAGLNGKQKSAEHKAVLNEIEQGHVQMVIGTHALFQKEVKFKHLGLMIIDEQHRFGVQQRLSLREKGVTNGLYPHQIIMSATPIPRSLAMVAYADLEHTIIDELPPGRTPIQTSVLPITRRGDVISRIKTAIAEQRQVYWICTLIEESENLQCQAAEKTYQDLLQHLLGCRVGLVHGKLKSPEKQGVMEAFYQGKIDVLVATTVIEVGVDVPNASLMVIENAERLGLAQIHQLRGRIGRGNIASFCVLLYQEPLSHFARERLKVLRESSDGFVIAERDLELRGPGELLSVRQAGLIPFRVADLNRDKKLIAQVVQAAQLINVEVPHLIPYLIRRWMGNVENYRHA